MTESSPETKKIEPTMGDRTSYLEQQRRHAEAPRHQIRAFIGTVIQRGKSLVQIGALGGALFLGQTVYENATEQNTAQAQDAVPRLTEEQRLEMARIFTEAQAAFNNHEYERARELFRQVEVLNTVGGTAIDANIAIIISWNICQIYAIDAGFRLFGSVPRESSSAMTTRLGALNDANRARLEAVLGFSTLAQIRPIRDAFTEMQRRLHDVLGMYESELLTLGTGGSSSRRSEIERGLEDTRRAIAFIENSLPRIETRYREIEGSTTVATVDPVPPVVPPVGPDPVVPTIPDPITPRTVRTERPWALGLGIGGGGLAVMGISGIVYFASNPQTVSDDQIVTTTSNILFWTGAAATLAGAGILIFGEHPVEGPTTGRRHATTTFTATVLPSPDGFVLSTSGTF